MLVFVYGTLTDAGEVDELLDDWAFVDEAVLEGLHRVDGAYPTLAPGGSVEGRLFRTEQVDRLDVYEGVDRGLYVRVTVPLTLPDGEGDEHDDDTIAVYVGDPERLGVPDTWPGQCEFVGRVRDVVEGGSVVIRVVG